MSPVRCSTRGMADQITGAAANQNALTNRYSLSALESSGLLLPGRILGPASMPANPDRNGITESTPRVVCRPRRPPSGEVTPPARAVWGVANVLDEVKRRCSCSPVKHYYSV